MRFPPPLAPAHTCRGREGRAENAHERGECGEREDENFCYTRAHVIERVS